MVFAFYGNYFLLLKQNDEKRVISLKEFIVEKPNLTEVISIKLEKVATKLIEKGLTRHTISHSILLDFFQTQKVDKVQSIADLIKENIPTLLTSKAGL